MDVFTARNGRRDGPFPLEEIRRQLASGAIRNSDLAWVDGMADWTPVSNLPGVVTAGLSSAQRLEAPVSSIRPPGSPAPATSGSAVASLILGILSVTVLPLLASISAVICGHVARGRIKETGGAQAGSGMAPIIRGYLVPALTIILAFLALPSGQTMIARGKESQSL